jgi:hypothetical protein
MHLASAPERFRWLTLLALCAMVLGSLMAPLSGQNVIAQESGGESIGDAPSLTGVDLAEASDPGAIALASGGAVDPSSRAASREYYFANFRQSIPPVEWTGDFASCVPGTSSAAHLQALLDQIAYYRAMAGVPADITFSAEYNAKAQQAALMMGNAQVLDHFPGPGWPCYTETGREAAGKSNLHYRIASGVVLPVSDAVTAYMEDAGDNNAAAGHRRWLLYPQTTTFGGGSVDAPWDGWDTYANAIWVMDANLGGPRPGTRDLFVAWPPPGYVPYQVTFPRWSFSYPGANFAGATVTATKNGGIPVSVLVESRSATGYGENTIVWSMEGLNDAAHWPKPSIDDHYTVTLSNVVIAGAPTTFTYTVKVFDPATDGAEAMVAPSRSTVGTSLAFLLASFPANTQVTVAWRRPSGTIDQLPGTFTTDANGDVAGSIVLPTVPGGVGHQIIFTASTGTTATAYFEVAPRIKVSPAVARRGETVDVSLRGFGRQDLVRIRWRTPAGGWEQVAEVTTSNSGSANVNVLVPDFASDGLHVVRAEGSTLNAQTNSVQVLGAIVPPVASISPTRSTVNNWIIYALSDFPPNSPVQITWTRLSGGTIDLGTILTDANGAATGQFRVPATPGGPNQTITFSSGTIQATAVFDVAARIKVNTVPGIRGQLVDVSLRGYGKQETVRIRWLNPSGQWIEVGQVITSNTGSANVMITVPSWAPDGANSVRGDGTQFRQQTNVVQISGGVTEPANAPTATPTPIVTPESTPAATETPIGSPVPETSETPSATETATPEPTETPLEPGTPSPESGA